MAGFKSKFLKQIAGQVSQEGHDGNFKGRDFSTEPVGDSGDAVVEIQRVKAAHERGVAISSLEQDLVEIEGLNDGVEELATAQEEIGELQQSMESYLENGGMTKGEAQLANMYYKSICNRIGFASNMPSMESFSGSQADRVDMTQVSMEGLGDMISNAWEAIKKFFKKMWEKIKSWFGKSKKTAKETSDELDKTAGSLKGKKTPTVKLLPAPKKELPSPKAEDEQAKDTVNVSEKEAATAESVVGGAKVQGNNGDEVIDTVTMPADRSAEKTADVLHKYIDTVSKSNIFETIDDAKVNVLADRFESVISSVLTKKTQKDKVVEMTTPEALFGDQLLIVTRAGTTVESSVVKVEPISNPTSEIAIAVSDFAKYAETVSKLTLDLSKLYDETEAKINEEEKKLEALSKTAKKNSKGQMDFIRRVLSTVLGPNITRVYQNILVEAERLLALATKVDGKVE